MFLYLIHLFYLFCSKLFSQSETIFTNDEHKILSRLSHKILPWDCTLVIVIVIVVVSKQLRLLHGRVGDSTILINSLSPQMSELAEDAIASWCGDIVGHFVADQEWALETCRAQIWSFHFWHFRCLSDILATSCTIRDESRATFEIPSMWLNIIIYPILFHICYFELWLLLNFSKCSALK